VVCGRIRTDAEALVTMLTFGYLERGGGLVGGEVWNGIVFRLSRRSDGYRNLLNRLGLRLPVLFLDSGKGADCGFLESSRDRDRLRSGDLGLCGVVCLPRPLPAPLGGFFRCLLVCMADGKLQFTAGKGRNP
jgi:hypothetical protein